MTNRDAHHLYSTIIQLNQDDTDKPPEMISVNIFWLLQNLVEFVGSNNPYTALHLANESVA
jgi:hypothetical protein